MAEPVKHVDASGHEHTHGPTSAKIVALGTVTVGGATFMIDRDGQIEAGKETEFGVERIAGAEVVPSGAWLANPPGSNVEKLCDPVTGDGHEQHWHFNVTPLYPVKKSKFVLQAGGEEAVVDFCPGAGPCNDGIMSVFPGVGFLELKLHGDAGDLELWLYGGFAMSNVVTKMAGGKPTPFDVPKETVVRVSFPSHDKAVELRVRNGEQNEDEDGTPNMRAGRTNYFIFPGESGQDPAWLVGEKARYVVQVAFEAEGKQYACDPFVFVPHEAL